MTSPADHRDSLPKKKSLARCLGEFIGHIAKGVRTDPNRKVVRKQVDEEERAGMTLRRTTIEEIELHSRKKPKASDDAR